MRPCLLLSLLLLLSCQETLLEGLDEPQANDGITALAAAGIEAQKRPTGRRFKLTVPRGALPRAWSVLKREGLPRVEAPSVEGGLLGDPSAGAEAARRHKGQALAALLRRSPEIIDAAVVLGARGAAVTLTLKPEAKPLPVAQLKAQLMAGGDLKDPAGIVIVQRAAPASALPPAEAPTARPGASLAAAAFALAALLLWVRLRLVRRGS